MVAPTIEINLSSDPSTRWTSSVDAILRTHGWNNSFGPIFKSHNQSLFDNIPKDVMPVFAEVIKSFWPSRFLEISGISNAFEKNGYSVSIEYLSAWVYFHELAHTEWQKSPNKDISHECTGIIAFDEKGEVVHGRNMDQSPPEVRNAAIHHVYKKNGEVQYESFTWYWMNAGFMTGVKPGVATCEENWRMEKIDSSDAMDDIKKGVLPQVWFFRNAFENYSSFDEITNFLQNEKITVGMYVISSGPSDGVIISRESGKGQLPLYRLSECKEKFLVQTNYDRWEPDPPTDPRRTVAENQMRSLKKIKEVSVFATLSTPPVRNEATAYSCILQASVNFTMEDQCFVMYHET